MDIDNIIKLLHNDFETHKVEHTEFVDFMENVNYYLTKYDVFMQMIDYIGEDAELKFWDSVKVIYSRYISRFLYNARSRLGLTNLINTDAFVIKRDLLNNIGSFDFKNKPVASSLTPFALSDI